MPYTTNLYKSWSHEMQYFIKYILANKCDVTFNEETNILFFPSKDLFLTLWNKVLNKNNSYPTISRSFSNYKIKALQVTPSKNIFKFEFPRYFKPDTLLIRSDSKNDTDKISSTEIDKKEVIEEGDTEVIGEDSKKNTIEDESVDFDNINNIIKFNKYISKFMISKYKSTYKKNKKDLIIHNLKKNNDKLNKLIYNIIELVVS